MSQRKLERRAEVRRAKGVNRGTSTQGISLFVHGMKTPGAIALKGRRVDYYERRGGAMNGSRSEQPPKGKSSEWRTLMQGEKVIRGRILIAWSDAKPDDCREGSSLARKKEAPQNSPSVLRERLKGREE